MPSKIVKESYLMTIRAQINDAVKTAMKAGDKSRLETLRMVNAAIKQKDIDTRSDTNKELVSDETILGILQGLIKQRRESAAMYRDGKREELAAKEEAEIAVIETYLPAQKSADEVAAIVAQLVTEAGATSIKDMGKVMGLLKTRYAGQLDMGAAGAAVKTALGG